MQPEWRSFSPAKAILLLAAIWAVAVVASQTSIDAQQLSEGVVLPAARPSRARPVPSPPAPASPATPQRPLPPALSGAEFVGEETCLACHETQKKGYAGTLHGRADHPRSPAAKQGCESCHGPGSRHLEDPTMSGTIQAFSRTAARDANTACLTCHARGAHAMWEGSVHEARGLACVNCHSVHAFKSAHGQLKTEREIDTCFGCHADKRADAMRASHHPLREGKMTCMDCHTPHGASDGGNLSAESVNEKCYECHTEKRGPFLWEHAPVRESCLNCHTPHGSNHQKLQKTSVPYLCQQCHSNTRHPGTLYDATTLPGQARQTNRLFERACVNCHAAIHGSNHPSGPYLGR